MDFRNRRFLSDFLTDAGKLTPRRQTKLSATLQRRVATAVRRTIWNTH